MSNTTTKVLAGCGVGCLLITVALVGLGWMGYRWARTAAEVHALSAMRLRSAGLVNHPDIGEWLGQMLEAALAPS